MKTSGCLALAPSFWRGSGAHDPKRRSGRHCFTESCATSSTVSWPRALVSRAQARLAFGRSAVVLHKALRCGPFRPFSCTEGSRGCRSGLTFRALDRSSSGNGHRSPATSNRARTTPFEGPTDRGVRCQSNKRGHSQGSALRSLLTFNDRGSRGEAVRTKVCSWAGLGRSGPG